MTDKAWGASPAEWDHFRRQVEVDLLPVVSNPGATISPASRMKGLGKTPSVYNRERNAVGLPDWTAIEATPGQVTGWARQPDYGICVQTRRWRALDIDVPDPELASAIADAFDLGGALPVRSRPNTGKRLLVFAYDGDLSKRVVRVNGGIVELLATGQQFAAIGTHESGARYEWLGGLPEDVPVWSLAEIDAAWAAVVDGFGVGEETRAGDRRQGGERLDVEDPVASYIQDGGWEHYGADRDGEKLFVLCPWKDGHSSDSGETEAAWLVAGTRGYERGHFQCLHASCSGRTDAEFTTAIGYEVAQFEDLSGEVVPAGAGEGEVGRVRPPYWRTKTGEIEPKVHNLLLALRDPQETGMAIAYDEFRDAIMWAPVESQPLQWRLFADEHYVGLAHRMEKGDFKSVPKETLRDCVWAVGKENSFDSAIEWASRLRWDGEARVERFLIDFAGAADGPYVRAVSSYMWTALAGRLLEPGCKADAVPVFVGPNQGEGKSSLAAAMSPGEEHFAELSFADSETENSRKMRGCLVAELGELRGLRTRELEAIKAWVTRRYEHWTPKWKEYASRYSRRCLFIGTTNQEQFLADETGERRWYPVRVALTGERACWLGAARLEADGGRLREQLWAEACVLFRAGGVAWQQAAALAPDEHGKYKIEDAWEDRVGWWLAQSDLDGGSNRARLDLTTVGVLQEALGLDVQKITQSDQKRVSAILRKFGLEQVWARGDGKPKRVWR